VDQRQLWGKRYPEHDPVQQVTPKAPFQESSPLPLGWFWAGGTQRVE